MNTQDQKRVMVLNRILDGQVSTAEAAALLKLSKRQVQRILAAVFREQEDRVGYFQLVQQLITRYGRPLAF